MSSSPNAEWGRGGVAVRLLASRLGKPGSIPGGVAPRFSHVGIVPDDGAGWRVFSRISRFPRPFIPALLHTHLASPSSSLQSSVLTAAQISSLTLALKPAGAYINERTTRSASPIRHQVAGASGLRVCKRSGGGALVHPSCCIAEVSVNIIKLFIGRCPSFIADQIEQYSVLLSLQVSYWFKFVQGVSYKLRANGDRKSNVHMFEVYSAFFAKFELPRPRYRRSSTPLAPQADMPANTTAPSAGHFQLCDACSPRLGPVVNGQSLSFPALRRWRLGERCERACGVAKGTALGPSAGSSAAEAIPALAECMPLTHTAGRAKVKIPRN
ncbi:hypothetical protein PR048_029217 [Dryococelus australis]|uniref:Uncharacterized protein n=1 Tax=Dryococelus australis TaxID=614101 RepID=A0ABQ9GCV5_9NEOP|nr:hypothetical protein PR048_029217 [Dryococelus australis]